MLAQPPDVLPDNMLCHSANLTPFAFGSWPGIRAHQMAHQLSHLFIMQSKHDGRLVTVRDTNLIELRVNYRNITFIQAFHAQSLEGRNSAKL